MNKEQIEKILGMPVPKEADLKRVLKEMGAADGCEDHYGAVLKLLETAKDKLPADQHTAMMGHLAKMSGYGMPVTKEAPAPVEPAEGEELKAVCKEDGTLDPEKLKGVPAAISKSLQKLWGERQAALKASETEKKRADAAELVVKEQKETERKKEFVAKASKLDKLPLKAEEFGAVLKELHDKAPEAAKKIDQILESCNAVIAAGTVFKELGADGGGGSKDPMAQLTAHAKELVQKSSKDGKPTISEAEGFSQAMQTPEGRKLYAEYQESHINKKK